MKNMKIYYKLLKLMFINNYYNTSPEICLYKSNTLDWYVIPRDKVKTITYGYANERAICMDKIRKSPEFLFSVIRPPE